MLSSSYPQLDASVANAGILASADEQAIERFKAAYTQYAKALGTNSARPVAISHLVGESGAIQAFTLHIRLAGVDQSLLALLILQESSLDAIDSWLINEFDEDLEREESIESGCDLIFGPKELRIEEHIPVLVDLDLDLRSVTELAVQSSLAVDRALSVFARLDTLRFDEDSPVKRKLTVYAMDADEQCDECGEDLILLAGVVDEEHEASKERRRDVFRQQIHREDFHDFCVILSWLCKESQVAEFTSLNHTCQSEEDIVKALSALHKDELSQIDSMMASVAGMMQELFGNLGEDEPEGGDTRPTLH